MEFVRIESNVAGIQSIVMARQEVHNAFNDQMISELIEAIAQCQQNPECRVVILKSEGRNFSAGADLTWMKRMAGLSEQENLDDANRLARLMADLYQLPKPVIAQVQGGAYGGALGLVACADIAIASHDATFCLSEVKIGLVPAVISPYVVRAIGERMAGRYFLSAETFDAQTAKNMALIHECVPEEQLDEQVMNLARRLLDNGPQALSNAKSLLHRLHGDTLDEHTIRYTSELIAQIRVSDEGQAGLHAFLNKEQPPWILNQ